MGLFSWLSGRSGKGGDEPASHPWDEKPSIYDHIQSHIAPDQPGLLEGGNTLPNDERIAQGGRLRWIPGGLDGCFSHHASCDVGEKVKELIALLTQYCQSPTAANKRRVYDRAVEHSAIEMVDPLLTGLSQISGLNLPRLYELAKSFTTEAPDREPVKLGIAILGGLSQERDKPLFLTLGRHEEFTLYCAVALIAGSSTPEQDLWELAQHVNGWGRIHVVERLAQTNNPEIKSWLLRDGYKNSVMYEYLACICARAGNLRTALDAEQVDDELLDAAADLIDALIRGGPAEDLDKYEDGSAAVSAFVMHMRARASTLPHLLTIASIQCWLANKDTDWAERESKGWTRERRRELLSVCAAIIDRPVWRELALSGLRSNDESQFHTANQAARILGIDTWSYQWDRLRQSPANGSHWFNVMRLCNMDRIAAVVTLADRELPLSQIATGPGRELGLGKEYQWHRCLDFILQDLGGFPGHGTSLIEAGLQSPVTRNRNMAVKAISEWGQGNWSPGLRDALEQAASKEPDEEIREAMCRVLNGQPWPTDGD